MLEIKETIMVNLCSWEQSRDQKSQAFVLFWNTSTLSKILQERRGQCHLLTMPMGCVFSPYCHSDRDTGSIGMAT